MLRLRSQAVHRLGIPGTYTCSSCRAATRALGASSLRSGMPVQQHVYDGKSRSFTNTAFRSAKRSKEKGGGPSKPVSKDNNVPQPSEPGPKNDKVSPPSKADAAKAASELATDDASKPGVSKSKKKRAKKAKKAAPDPVEDSQHQLKVLQGALAALKNVLDQQNIKVDDIKKAETRGARPNKSKSSVPEASDAPRTPKSSKSKAQPATAKPRETARPRPPGKVVPRPQVKTHPKPPKTASPKPEARVHKATSGHTPDRVKVNISRVKADMEKRREDITRLMSHGSGKLKKDINSTEPLVRIARIDAKDLDLVPIERSQPPVPAVSYGLERVLFNPGVYHLQDPRSKVFNFDPYLANIMPVQEFDFDALKQYITSSKDVTLIDVARENGKKYTGSTSSMTSMLSHFHYLLSAWRPINSSMMSQGFQTETEKFTNLLRAPAATFLHWKDGVYAIDADKEFDSASILSMLGKSMEKLLTVPTEEFEKYRRGNSHQISEEERNAAEAYHYTGLGDFMMRSQLDAHDPRIPGTGMFDIKTRAVVSIRMDAKGYTKGLGYELRHRHGNWESYEREYHDMIRAAFLKYSLQVRMGRMDGIFVAFHNTQRIFGFQYIPLQEMDLSLHGTSNLSIGDKEFKLSLALLNKLLDRASEKFPKQSLRLFVETRTSANTPFLYAFVKPVEAGEIEAVQNSNKESIELFEKELVGLGSSTESESVPSADEEVADNSIAVDQENDTSESEENGLEEVEDTTVSWEEIQMMVEDAMEDEELGIEAVRQAIEDALEESGLLEDQSLEESRGYVDALLGAVTGASVPSSSETANTTGVEDADMASAEVNVIEPITDKIAESDASSETSTILPVAEDNDGELVHDKQEPQSPSISSATSESGMHDTTTTKLVEQAEEESELEEADSQDESAASPDMSTLSNLILRMTRRLDENGPTEKQRDADVSLKLQEFERVLGKLISESREDEPEPAASSMVESVDNTSTETEDVPETTEKSADEQDSTGPGDATASVTGDVSQASGSEAESAGETSILGMVLTVRNKVNDRYVPRPEDLTEDDTWEIEYSIEEMDSERAHRLFEMCKKRRQKAFSPTKRNSQQFGEMFGGALKKFCNQGREFRSKEEAAAKERPVLILGEPRPKSYDEVFARREKQATGKNA